MKLVVKIGGSLIQEGHLNHILANIASIHKEHEIIIVHGGGALVSEISKKLGKEPMFIKSPNGIVSRYTDEETAQIYNMVMSGMIAPKIVTQLHKFGVKTISFSGYDSDLIVAERKKKLVVINERGRKMVIDGGYTGKIISVNKTMLENLLNEGLIPVLSPVAISQNSELLNVDSDRAASAVASSIKALKLVLLSNVDGLIINESLVRRISPSQAKELLPKIGPGMDKKVMAAADAVENGVRCGIISSGKKDNPVSDAVKEQEGTVIKLE